MSRKLLTAKQQIHELKQEFDRESKLRSKFDSTVHDPAKVRIPAYHPDNAELRRDWARYYDIVSAADATVAAADILIGKCVGLNRDEVTRGWVQLHVTSGIATAAGIGWGG